jgi:hypothetical protein
MSIRRIVAVLVLIVMVATVLPSTTLAQKSVNECAAFPASGVGPGDLVATNVRLAWRPLPSISEGRPYGVLPRGKVMRVRYGPSCTPDYQRWYLCEVDNSRCGWVAIGKLYPNWYTLAAPHVKTCVAQLANKFSGYSAGAPTLEAEFKVPAVYGPGAAMIGQPGAIESVDLGSDGIYRYMRVTIANPSYWGYGDGPLGDPMLYYYC